MSETPAPLTFDETGHTTLRPPGHPRLRFRWSRERFADLARQRYYTGPIDNSFPLTTALLSARLLRQDLHGHYEPTKRLDDLVASFNATSR